VIVPHSHRVKPNELQYPQNMPIRVHKEGGTAQRPDVPHRIDRKLDPCIVDKIGAA